MGSNISDTGGQTVGTTAGGLDGWVGTLDLSDPAASVISGNFDEVVNGTNYGDTGRYTFSNVVTGGFGRFSFNRNTGEYRFTADRDAVFQSGSNQTVSFSVVGANGDDDTVTINILICVARGTLIDTPAGPRPVEELCVGDAVSTLDAGAAPVLWIGSRRLGAAELAAAPELAPVRLRAGSLGPGVPRRDLLVSPQHRVLLRDWRAEFYFGQPEVLVPAKALVNDHSVTVEGGCREVEYFHLLFDRHQIMLTEGAPTESFHPGPWSLGALSDPVRAELLRLFPELESAAGGFGPAARPAVPVAEGAVLSRGAWA